MLEFGTARSGNPTLAMDGRFVHSRFDPQREAQRYLDGDPSRFPPAPSCAVVVGSGLGYLIDAARKRWPGIKVVSVRLLPGASDHTVAEADCIIPVDGRPPDVATLERELLECLDEEDADAPAIIRWEPVCSRLPRLSTAVDLAIRNVVRQLTSSRMTVGFFGRRWIRNTFRNFLRSECVVSARRLRSSVVIAASGPSLEKALPIVADARPSLSVWSLPSALPFLRYCGVEPDLIVLTDPGFYNMYHLRSATSTVPLAMPLTAQRATHDGPMLLLDQGSFVEREINHRVDLPALPVPSNGTVAGTAHLLARRVGAGRTVFLGLDMAALDIRAHARPHGFDGLLFEESSRLHPELTVRFERVASAIPVVGYRRWRADRALSTYASWFRRNSGDALRVTESPVDLAMRRVSVEEAIDAARGEKGRTGLEIEPADWPSIDERTAVIRGILDRWSGISSELRNTSRADRIVRDNRELFTAIDLPALLRYGRDPASGTRELCQSLDEFVADAGKYLEVDG